MIIAMMVSITINNINAINKQNQCNKLLNPIVDKVNYICMNITKFALLEASPVQYIISLYKSFIYNRILLKQV